MAMKTHKNFSSEGGVSQSDLEHFTLHIHLVTLRSVVLD